MEHESQYCIISDRCPSNKPIKSRNWFKEKGNKTRITELQKTGLPHTVKIFRKVLEIKENLLLLDLNNINPLLKQCII